MHHHRMSININRHLEACPPRTAQPPVTPEPAPVPTVADLAERYRREYVEMHCKPITVSH